MQKRVVVTGLAPVTPIGIGKDEFEEGWVTNRKGITRVKGFDTSTYPTKIAGEINIDFSRWLSNREIKKMDRFTTLSVIAADLAIYDAKLDTEKIGDRVGTFIGTACGGADSWLDGGRAISQGRRVGPRIVPNGMANSAASHVSIRHNLCGPSMAPVSACSSGLDSIISAAQSISLGEIDIAIAGGADAPVSPIPFGGFCVMGAMSRSNETPASASRPFSNNRDGFVIAEGAALLVLEEYNHAKARNVPIYAELKGFGRSSDAFHITQPSTEGIGAQRAMHAALNSAGIEPSKIDYIAAHGTATQLNDISETLAIKNVFYKHAYSLKVSSLKGNLGHSLGAAGPTAAISAIQGICSGKVPGTANLNYPDPKLDLNFLPNEPQQIDPEYVMVNSNAFGGENISVIFSKI
ncbi:MULTISPECIES: beta-ketoacyl-[acyl-carrier-protein] synthase family protein [Rothia]|uniref:beta-ketoacyl-[acyl-carrier-protein] synthase family protein n=1 Tax=Rothia TaxID=32207 RepID=UPI0009F43327|nr:MULTISPECIES: beta-ketoacyl-[acyl-carrier-protein] synthase family protein [Rothia]